MPKYDPQILAERIRMHRARLRLTQKDVGASTSASQNLVGMWEREEAVPDASQLAMLAKLFDVSTDYLVGLTDHPHGLPPGYYVVNLDEVESPKPGGEWAWRIPARLRIMSEAEVDAIEREKLKRKRR